MVVPESIIQAVFRSLAHTGRCVVAIDGRGGAGKSTLARAIVAAVPGAAHIEYDWFHLPRERVTAREHFDYQRCIDDLLKPFCVGERAFSLRRYNWGYLSGIEDGFDPNPIMLSLGDVIVIEGCGLLCAVLNNFFDVRIWVNTSAAESLKRGMARDVNEYKLDPTRVKNVWEEWAKWEAEDPEILARQRRADFVV